MARRSLRLPWMPEDDQLLIELRNAGHSTRTIAVRLKRTESAVDRRARVPGLVGAPEPSTTNDVEFCP